jgi:hypothetical protein
LTMNLALVVVFAHAVAAVALGSAYFRRYRMKRPPIGVFNLADVSVMVLAIVLVPFLYVALPKPLVVAILFVGMTSLLYFTWEGVTSRQWMRWLVALVMSGADLAASWYYGSRSPGFLAVNNVVLIVAVVGATNLWAQSGLRARDATVLGVALIAYDIVATWWLPLTTDLINRLAGMPFAPVVAWGDPAVGLWLGIGMGDLLLATAFPLVMRKAYGRRAAVGAIGLALGAIGGLLLVARLGLLSRTFPVMVLLGPLMVIQYAFWHRRLGAERTTWQYLQAEPL